MKTVVQHDADPHTLLADCDHRNVLGTVLNGGGPPTESTNNFQVNLVGRSTRTEEVYKN
jgi:hypothetical protein